VSYDRSVDVTLPDGISGTYYIVVNSSGPFEFIYGNNNQRVSGPLNVQLSDRPTWW